MAAWFRERDALFFGTNIMVSTEVVAVYVWYEGVYRLEISSVRAVPPNVLTRTVVIVPGVGGSCGTRTRVYSTTTVPPHNCLLNDFPYDGDAPALRVICVCRSAVVVVLTVETASFCFSP